MYSLVRLSRNRILNSLVDYFDGTHHTLFLMGAEYPLFITVKLKSAWFCRSECNGYVFAGWYVDINVQARSGIIYREIMRNKRSDAS